MDDQALEVRHALHRSAAAAATIKLDEPSQIDPYTREADAVVQPGLLLDECIHRVETIMGLEYDAQHTTRHRMIFTIKYSNKYKALQVNVEQGTVSGYMLLDLAPAVADDKL